MIKQFEYAYQVKLLDDGFTEEGYESDTFYEAYKKTEELIEKYLARSKEKHKTFELYLSKVCLCTGSWRYKIMKHYEIQDGRYWEEYKGSNKNEIR